MRPQQQGRRSRNRGGGRRSQNPLQRSFESNGPDVKIRGNAQVIADKYSTLARDALSSGDTVMAENYLQHAEHYNRIILAAQPQQREGGDEQSARDGGGEEQAGGDETRGRRDRDGQRRSNGGAEAQDQRPQSQGDGERSGSDDSGGGATEQPVIEGTPAEVRAEEEQQLAETEKPRRTRQRRPRKAPEAEAPETEPAKASEDDQETPVAAE